MNRHPGTTVTRTISVVMGIALAAAGASAALRPARPAHEPRPAPRTANMITLPQTLMGQPAAPAAGDRPRTALNPQPLPPGRSHALNPQPLPPGVR